jgi:hypothetical protein
MFVNPVPIQQGFEREPEHRNAEAGALASRATIGARMDARECRHVIAEISAAIAG